jgi:hypothetical protein
MNVDPERKNAILKAARSGLRRHAGPRIQCAALSKALRAKTNAMDFNCCASAAS